jgi:hypothetical protein
MKLLRVHFFACAGSLALSACGTASVQYASPLQSPTAAPADAASNASVAAILAAAAKGSQTLALPVSRLVGVGTAAQAGNADQKGGAVGDAAPPPPEAAAAPKHAAKPAAGPAPAKIGQQPAAQAAVQAGGANNANPAASTSPPPSVTTTLTSADGATKYAVNVVQVESVVSFMVQPTNDFFSANDFSVTRLANTRIPTTVSNTFTDETASRVKAIASVAAALIPLAAAAAPPHGAAATLTAPQCLSDDMVVNDVALNPSVPGSNANFGGWSGRKASWSLSGKCLDISLVADPLAPNLVPIASLAGAFVGKNSDWTKVWPVPACMSVQVIIKPHGAPDDDPKSATGHMTVIDPDYVELMPIPQKGKIAMHPICGADLADSTADPYQADFDTITAIVAAFPAKATSK